MQTDRHVICILLHRQYHYHTLFHRTFRYLRVLILLVNLVLSPLGPYFEVFTNVVVGNSIKLLASDLQANCSVHNNAYHLHEMQDMKLQDRKMQDVFFLYFVLSKAQGVKMKHDHYIHTSTHLLLDKITNTS